MDYSKLSPVQLFATPWTVALQAPLSVDFSRQEYLSGLPFSISGDLPNPRIDPSSLMSPELVSTFFTTALLGQPPHYYGCFNSDCCHSLRIS